jgi:hypothetical protein
MDYADVYRLLAEKVQQHAVYAHDSEIYGYNILKIVRAAETAIKAMDKYQRAMNELREQ